MRFRMIQWSKCDQVRAMTITIPNNRTIPLEAKAGGGFRSVGMGDVATTPDYTPLVAEDFESETLGQTYADGSWKANYSVIDSSQVYAGTKSLKVIAETYDGITCGGLRIVISVAVRPFRSRSLRGSPFGTDLGCFSQLRSVGVTSTRTTSQAMKTTRVTLPCKLLVH